MCLTFTISRGSYVSSFHSLVTFTKYFFFSIARNHSPPPHRFAKISAYFLPSFVLHPFEEKESLAYLLRKTETEPPRRKMIAGVPRPVSWRIAIYFCIKRTCPTSLSPAKVRASPSFPPRLTILYCCFKEIPSTLPSQGKCSGLTCSTSRFRLHLPRPNSPLRYFPTSTYHRPSSGAWKEEEGGEQSSELESTGHFMMTTKVVRPPLGRRERGWQGETELLPLLEAFFLLEHLRRGGNGWTEEEEKEERGWITKAREEKGSCCSQGLELIAFITQKKKNSLPLHPHLPYFPLTSASIPPPIFNLCRARHWRISK